jgi:hypothetical protein
MYWEPWLPPDAHRLPTGSKLLSIRLALPDGLDAQPLRHTLQAMPEVQRIECPSLRMGALLNSGQVDAAWLPVSELPGLCRPTVILPAGCAACRGLAPTARVFLCGQPEAAAVLRTTDARQPATMLARLLWATEFGVWLMTAPPRAFAVDSDAEAVLAVLGRQTPPLSPRAIPFNLCRMWFELTGLPFTFRVWAARAEADLPALNDLLVRARRGAGTPDVEGCRQNDLGEEFTPEHHEGLREFFERAEELCLVDKAPSLRVFRP